ncbi:hypothetical protein [Yersinia aldovae]|uniref:hypothetical protein n=1 Tax=Yersinia aldovae TaxID=29483 RepID=UPI0011A2E1FC|nr:hypothetical protein [Yersinia aldovae]
MKSLSRVLYNITQRFLGFGIIIAGILIIAFSVYLFRSSSPNYSMAAAVIGLAITFITLSFIGLQLPITKWKADITNIGRNLAKKNNIHPEIEIIHEHGYSYLGLSPTSRCGIYVQEHESQPVIFNYDEIEEYLVEHCGKKVFLNISLKNSHVPSIRMNITGQKHSQSESAFMAGFQTVA